MARLRPLWSVAIAGVLFAIFRTGLANWDTAYALVFGSEVASGRRPDFDGVALAPTTHPLADLVGLLLAGFGDAAEPMAVALGFLALGVVGYLVYRLATTWFGPIAGVAAAVIVLTREPVLSVGVRAYVDLPYLAFILGALAVETRRPRSGTAVLGLLALAGLLRPEAWLFSAAYLVLIAFPRLDPRARRAAELEAPGSTETDEGGAIDPTREESRAYWEARRRRELAARSNTEGSFRKALRLLPFAVAAPALWALLDLASTGDALASLNGTRDNVEALGRDTGLDGLASDGPRRLGEVLREPGLIAAAIGAGLGLVWLRARTLAALAASALALVALAILAAAGLPIITRYFLALGALASVLGGAAVGGWLEAGRGLPRWAWLAAGLAVLALFAAFAPSQARRISDLRDAIVAQDRIQEDLHDLAKAEAFPRSCLPIVVPSSRPVPLLALWLDRPPEAFVTPGDARQPSRGVYLLPASNRFVREVALDPRDPGATRLRRPAGFVLQGRNRSWGVYARC
ncbi:MAG: hypothetical protein ACR2ML_03210 [Solirubrobacteraceae bacterium]